MTFSSLTRRTVAHHGKYHSRNGRKVERIIIHHWAGTRGGDARLTNPRESVSANYILYSNGDLVGQVPEEYRAWTSGSASADGNSITVEIQNSSGRKHGNDNHRDSWAISSAAWNTLINLIADLGRRYRWGSISSSRVRGHREFAPTACPGGYLWNRMGTIRTQAQTKLKGGSTTTSKGTKVMKHYQRRDLNAGKRKTGRVLKPGAALYLNEKNNVASQATNIVGGIGYYDIKTHIYAEGRAGDKVTVTLLWSDTRKKPAKRSWHYKQELEIGSDGSLKDTTSFARHVSQGFAVYMHVSAHKSNKGNVKLTLVASDAYLFN